MSITGRRGRPPLAMGEPTVQVHVVVPESAYQRLRDEASHAGISVPELVRRRALVNLGTQNRQRNISVRS